MFQELQKTGMAAVVASSGNYEAWSGEKSRAKDQDFPVQSYPVAIARPKVFNADLLPADTVGEESVAHK